jgi:hypothetical protein
MSYRRDSDIWIPYGRITFKGETSFFMKEYLNCSYNTVVIKVFNKLILERVYLTNINTFRYKNRSCGGRKIQKKTACQAKN